MRECLSRNAPSRLRAKRILPTRENRVRLPWWAVLLFLLAGAGVFFLCGYLAFTPHSLAFSQGGRGGIASNLAGPDLNPADWVWNGLTGFWDKLWRVIVDLFHQILDWASSFGFVYITPAALTYKNPMVLAGANWSMLAMDGFVALLLVVSGYQVVLYRYLDLPAPTILGAVVKVALAAIVANVAFLVLLPNLVELSNTMSLGIIGALLHDSSGDMSLPLGALNWLGQPFTWAVFILIDFGGSVFLVFVDVVRLGVLDLTIFFFPLWTIALSNEVTRNWGRLGATTFFCALFLQPIQTGVIALGSAMIANWGHLNLNGPTVCTQLANAAAHATCVTYLGHASISGSMTPVTLLLGIADIYIAYKLPGMLFSNAVRASIGAVNRDVAGVAKAAFSVILLQRQLNK